MAADCSITIDSHYEGLLRNRRKGLSLSARELDIDRLAVGHMARAKLSVWLFLTASGSLT